MAARTTADQLSVCKQCTSQIARGEDHIACEGFCQNVFHARCTKLNADTLLSCKTKPNVWWTCDSCTRSMRTMRNDRLSRSQGKEDVSTSPNACDDPKMKHISVDLVSKCEDTVQNIREEMVMMKQQISAIRDSMDQIMSQREHPFELSASSSSSPISSTKLMQGSGHTDAFDLSCDRAVSDRFWLFFTRIKNTTTEKQILDMVTRSLGRGSGCRIIVKKLVPFGKETSTMQYISFKVGIDPEMKNAAMIPSTWPAGICYRQFISYE